MWYIDVDKDDDGYADYRGVYFTSYRPNTSISSDGSNSTQLTNGYHVNTVYWFKYDPIEWRLCFTQDGKSYVISEYILDVTYFENSSNTSSFSHNGGTDYGNSYKYSDLKNFVSTNFEAKLTTAQKNLLVQIQSSNVTSYVNIFAQAGVPNIIASSRIGFGTAYAKCMGLQVYTGGSTETRGSSPWWTTSAASGTNNSNKAYYVPQNLSPTTCYVYSSTVGVRPSVAFNATKVTRG